MQYLRRLFLIAIFFSPLSPLPAQENPGNLSSNLYEPQIIFSNPAGIAFKQNRQVVVSSQLLYTGLENDQLYSHRLGYLEPLGDFGVVGFRGNLFNSYTFKENDFSLLYSRLIPRLNVGLGLNLNLHHQNYDQSHFQLKDLDDPLLAKGLSATAFSVGISALFSPTPDFFLGMSLNQLNQPNISLAGAPNQKPLIFHSGVGYRILNFIPEFSMGLLRYQFRKEFYYAFGIRQLFFRNLANLSFHYQPEHLVIGAAYQFKQFRLEYAFQYALNELQEISDGSHQITFSYNWGSGQEYPFEPEIMVLSPTNFTQDSATYRLQAEIRDVNSLKQVQIFLNDEPVGSRQFSRSENENQIELDLALAPLREGRNSVKIVADNGQKQAVKEFSLMTKVHKIEAESFTAKPKIELLTPLDDETDAHSLRLKVSVEFVLELKDIQVKVNGEKIELRGTQPHKISQDAIELDTEIDLTEGMNEIEFTAFNSRGSHTHRQSIRYNPIQKPLYDQLWAVVIGIDNYLERGVTDLTYAVHDAKGVEKLLSEQFRFDHIISLYNHEATRNNIVSAISSQLREAKETDGIFIFFSGHGCTGEGVHGGPLGYIVPVDGTLNPADYYVKNIPMSLVREISQTIKAKHIFFVIDCCYGGLLLRDAQFKIPEKQADYSYLRSIAEKPVRQVLTAGGKDQPVLDGGLYGHSVFTGVLLQALNGESDANQDGFITAEELNFFVRQRVHTTAQDVVRGHPAYNGIEQTPQYGKWFGDGEFVFRLK